MVDLVVGEIRPDERSGVVHATASWLSSGCYSKAKRRRSEREAGGGDDDDDGGGDSATTIRAKKYIR
jgi:hypothetical protein